jgi:hypothetical protein
VKSSMVERHFSYDYEHRWAQERRPTWPHYPRGHHLPGSGTGTGTSTSTGTDVDQSQPTAGQRLMMINAMPLAGVAPCWP